MLGRASSHNCFCAHDLNKSLVRLNKNPSIRCFSQGWWL